MTDAIWIHYARPRPRWYQLSHDEQTGRQAVWSAAGETSKAAGGEPLGRYHIRGQHDFETVEMWRFPNAQAAFDHWARLTAAGYNELFAFSNNIGLTAEQP
jgi:hypothetical protein